MDHDWFYLFGMLEIIGNLFWILSRRLEIYGKSMFYISNVQKKHKHRVFGIFTKKTRAEILRILVCRIARDLSYETHSGPKTKTEKSAPLGRGFGGRSPLMKKINNPVCGLQI